MRSEMIPLERRNLTYWNKLYELQYKMLFNNQENVAGHMYASEPLDWLFLKRGVAYWISANSNVSVVLMNNVVLCVVIDILCHVRFECVSYELLFSPDD